MTQPTPPRRRRSRNSTSYAHIEGLEDFLRRAGVVGRDMAQANKVFAALASQTVAATARADARQQGSVMAKSAANISVPKPGWVQYGGEGYSMGAEFGSYQYKQFQTWRGNGDDAGYFLWPAIREFRDEEMLDLWVQEAWKAVKPMFPTTGA